MKQGVLAGACALHLLFVFCAALAIPLYPHTDNPLWRSIDAYRAVSGADNGFSFFAPGVAGDMRARFEVENGLGRRETAFLRSGEDKEADRRLTNAIALSWNHIDDDSLRRFVTASWAAKIFGRYPGAKAVWISVEFYDLPSMSAFRAGKRGRWVSVYKARYSHERDDERGVDRWQLEP